MGNVPWVNQGQFSHACLSRYSLLDSQAFKRAPCTCAQSCYSTACRRFKPSPWPLCSWVYSPTPFMSSASFITLGFLVFSLPGTLGPLYIRHYCLNYVYLSPVKQKTHCCCSFILPVIFNSNPQTIHLKIIVSSLLALCCGILLKAFETEKKLIFFPLWYFVGFLEEFFYADRQDLSLRILFYLVLFVACFSYDSVVLYCFI